MKKDFQATLLWVVLATALPTIGIAQDTSTIDKLLTYIIAPLDKGQIPTQYLAEKGTIFLGMNTFNGTLTDDNVLLLKNKTNFMKKFPFSFFSCWAVLLCMPKVLHLSLLQMLTTITATM